MIGRDALLFGILIVLFGGFIYLGDGTAFDPNAGYWFMIFGLVVGFVGLVGSLADGLAE